MRHGLKHDVVMYATALNPPSPEYMEKKEHENERSKRRAQAAILEERTQETKEAAVKVEKDEAAHHEAAEAGVPGQTSNKRRAENDDCLRKKAKLGEPAPDAEKQPTDKANKMSEAVNTCRDLRVTIVTGPRESNQVVDPGTEAGMRAIQQALSDAAAKASNGEIQMFMVPN